jgi:hypothetical protein
MIWECPFVDCCSRDGRKEYSSAWTIRHKDQLLPPSPVSGGSCINSIFIATRWRKMSTLPMSQRSGALARNHRVRRSHEIGCATRCAPFLFTSSGPRSRRPRRTRPSGNYAERPPGGDCAESFRRYSNADPSSERLAARPPPSARRRFSGVRLYRNRPLVWLVAPGLRFHSATDTLLKYLSPEIQLTRMGLSENWRRGTENYFSAVTGKIRPNKKEGKRPGLNQYHFPGCVLEVIKILDVNGGKRLP